MSPETLELPLVAELPLLSVLPPLIVPAACGARADTAGHRRAGAGVAWRRATGVALLRVTVADIEISSRGSLCASCPGERATVEREHARPCDDRRRDGHCVPH